MLSHYITICFSFSKRPFQQFLEDTRFAPSDVLLYEPKAFVSEPPRRTRKGEEGQGRAGQGRGWDGIAWQGKAWQRWLAWWLAG